jgi:hypothetical protein
MGLMRKSSFVLYLGLVAACSSSSSSGTTALSASQACGDEATALCNKVSSCYSTFFQYLFSDMGTCTSGFQGTCTAALGANGTASTPSSIESCSQAINGLGCTDALAALADNNTPSACQPPAGSLTDGTVCGDSAQCAHQYCKVAAGSTCGACSSRVPAGSPCALPGNNDCQYGLVCAGLPNAKTGTCVAPGAGGATCDATHPCAGDFVCKSGTCTAPGKPGDTCDAAAEGLFCDTVGLVFCLPVQNTCVQAAVVPAGSSCGLTGGNTVAVCAGGGNNSPSSDCSSVTNGTCQAQIANGGACTAGSASGCTYPAVCAGGVCTLPDAASCH